MQSTAQGQYRPQPTPNTKTPATQHSKGLSLSLPNTNTALFFRLAGQRSVLLLDTDDRRRSPRPAGGPKVELLGPLHPNAVLDLGSVAVKEANEVVHPSELSVSSRPDHWCQ